jgi:trehalose 6-phosphate synthase
VEIEELKVTLVVLDEAAYDLMYNHLTNPLLWFVQHGLYDLPYSPNLGDDTRRAWQEGYLPVNESFAEAVARSLGTEGSGGEDALVLVHDYQLYAVPH